MFGVLNRDSSTKNSVGNLPAQKTSSKQQQQQQSQNAKGDLFRMRYFRFKSNHLQRTIEFYTTLGLEIDYDLEQDRILPVLAAPPTQQVQITQAGSKKAGRDSTNAKPEPTIQLPSGLDDLGFSQRVVAFSYHATDADNTQLVFEETFELARKRSVAPKSTVVDIDDAETADLEKKANTESYLKKIDKKIIHKTEYMVFYTHFIDRIRERLVSKGFLLLIEPTDIDGIKFAVLNDPNGIEVRLYELTEKMLNETNKKANWFTRFGYYAIPTSHADETTLHYESLFQIRVPKASQKADKADRDHMMVSKQAEEESSQPQYSLRKIGANGIMRQAITKAQGFRVVDMEEYIVGLNDSVFYWLGNDLRTNAATICLTEISNADTKIATTKFNPDSSRLIGIGFEVPNLDPVINRLKHETKDQLEWLNFRWKIATVGIFAKFRDKYNGLLLELYCSKIPEPPLPKQEVVGGIARLRVKSARVDPQVQQMQALGTKETAPKNDTMINMNHLRGHARFLSVGAIVKVKPKGEVATIETTSDKPNDQQIPVNQPENEPSEEYGKFLDPNSKARSKFMSKVSSLAAFSKGAKKAKQKTKEELQQELFIKRKKSPSCLF